MSPINTIKADSELKKLEGMYNILSFFEAKQGSVILRDACEVLIMKGYRKHLLNKRHSTHLSHKSMLSSQKAIFSGPTSEII